MNPHLLLAVTAVLGLLNSPCFAHDTRHSSHEHSGSAQATNRVTITMEGESRMISANGWPDHEPGQFPRRGNPNLLSPQSHFFRVPLNPQVSTQPTPSRGWFGVALNGVPFEPGTAEAWNNDRRSGWRYEANTGFLNLGLDEHNAHVQPTGAYHYHALPVGLVERQGGGGQGMLLIGWAADGFPIYTGRGYSDPNDAASPARTVRSSYRLKSGKRAGGPGDDYDGRFTEDFEYICGAGDLDECNGRFGVTPEFPAGIYHYYITDTSPFIARLHRGVADPSFSKRRGPPGGGHRGGAPQRGGHGPQTQGLHLGY